MFIWTAKIERKKIAAVLAAGLCVCAAGLALLWPKGQAASAAIGPKGVKTEEDRIAYLQSWGWQVPEQASLVEELELPEEFGPEYERYLSLQSDQGFDLTRYAGKRVRRYTYEVCNYPTGETGVIAHLLLYKNRVIGGEVMGGSFLHGLSMPG